jgi:hypothetical protein
VGGKFLEGATLQKATGLELIRGWEDRQLAFIPESSCTPKTLPIGWPMGNSVPKTRRLITAEISYLEKDGRKGRTNTKGKKERKETRR